MIQWMPLSANASQEEAKMKMSQVCFIFALTLQSSVHSSSQNFSHLHPSHQHYFLEDSEVSFFHIGIIAFLLQISLSNLLNSVKAM